MHGEVLLEIGSAEGAQFHCWVGSDVLAMDGTGEVGVWKSFSQGLVMFGGGVLLCLCGVGEAGAALGLGKGEPLQQQLFHGSISVPVLWE